MTPVVTPNIGRPDNIHRSGVALMLGKLLQKAFIAYELLSDRLISAKFQAQVGHLVVIQCPPTTDDADEETDAFYAERQRTTDYTPDHQYQHNKLCLCTVLDGPNSTPLCFITLQLHQV